MVADNLHHDRITSLGANGFDHSSQDASRATSPGVGPSRVVGGIDGEEMDIARLGRTRARVFPYAKYLPYQTETQDHREHDLDEMIKRLYIAVAAGDFVPGAVHWTKEIRGWMSLKFDLTRRQRITLIRLYYDLALAPGIEHAVSERFASMFMVLTKRKHYLRPAVDLTLDWRPLYREIKVFVLPSEFSTSNTFSSKRNIRTLTKMCTFAQLFFDPAEIPAMLEEFLPFYSTSFAEHAFVVLGLLNLMLPTSAPSSNDPKLQPQYYLPTLFHLWSTLNRSLAADTRLLDIFSRQARDCLGSETVKFGPCGIFTTDQSSLIFTSILRLLEIPVGQASTPYSASVDLAIGTGIYLERDARKHPVSHSIARWIIMSLSPIPASESGEKTILEQLEALIQGIETFFHPSNAGNWSKTLAQLVYFLADFFVMRWNREQNGEYDLPQNRRLNAELKRRFVLCLREVVFMGIYAKSSTAMSYALSTLQSLAYLEPTLILPGALQRIYPAMQGLVEVHRTISSIRALQMLSRTIARTRGFRCHLTTLLGLALPGIDANDLDKTMHSLAFIQAVCYNIPLHDLTLEQKRVKSDLSSDYEVVDAESPTAPPTNVGTALAVEWITGQVSRFEQEGPAIEIDYEAELTSADEEAILKSSTAGFAEFIISFMGRVFTLLQNLPDAARVKSGSPEENVINTLPAAFSPLLASLSPELYDIALEQVAKFISNHVVHQARDAMAFVCNALVKISPKKALRRLVPDLIGSIRTEITENGAGSTRTTGSEILPRDRALVWHVSLLSMCVVHVGADVLEFQDELLSIADFMQDTCKGIPLVHVSNFVHHLLLDLTVTYTTDYSLYERKELERGLTPDSWGRAADIANLDIDWHVPSQAELDFAVKLFDVQSQRALRNLEQLISDTSPVQRDGVGKEWSDEVSRHLVLLRLTMSGISRLFRSDDQTDDSVHSAQNQVSQADEKMSGNTDDFDALQEPDDHRLHRSYQYPTGYPLQIDGATYKHLHEQRVIVGEMLARVHEFLVKYQEDDVPCFNALYSAYKSWFVDIGIERSAHVLDRLTRLLSADISPFKLSGLRKSYPRPLLIRRANLYHFQRLRYNEHPRVATKLDENLLSNLAISCTSLYTDVRRTAQSAVEQAVKCIIGGKPHVIPHLLVALKKALDQNDNPRIKGAVYSLLFGSLSKTIARNWIFAPEMIRLFVRVGESDQPSIQKLVANSSFTIQDMTKAMDRMAILNHETLEAIWPDEGHVDSQGQTVAKSVEDVRDLIGSKRDRIAARRVKIETCKAQLSRELVESIKVSHWRKASRMAMMVVGLDYRFETIASEAMLELVVKGAIDPHPNLRLLYITSMNAIFGLAQTRAIVGHKFENYLLVQFEDCDQVDVQTERDDPDWTTRFLSQFAQPTAEAYIDTDYPGWLVWQKKIRAFQTGETRVEYDAVEQRVRTKMGSYIDRHWLSTFFGYMKQEPRDQNADRFRMTNTMTISFVLDLMTDGLTDATMDDFKELTRAVYADGSDKHQHRATAEILCAMLTSSDDFKPDIRAEIWEFAFPLIRRIFTDGLTPENSTYWSSFATITVGGKDPRRVWPMVDWLAGFRLDMETNAAFKESSKIQLLSLIISSCGWHFQLERPIVDDFIAHIDHPYKGVREVMGSTLALIFRTRYHESYRDIATLLENQRAASSIGTRPYDPSAEYTKIMTDTLTKLEQWRLDRPAGAQMPTPYTQASKTLIVWLDSTLSNLDCTTLVPFFSNGLMKQLLNMMDIKEDLELQTLAYHVFRHLPNIPHRVGEDDAFVTAMIKIGREASSWHQRLRVLVNIQVFYFRHLFLMSAKQAEDLIKCVREMLHDAQLEVRLGATATLSGIIRCSPVALRDQQIDALKKHFTNLLVKNPLPKRDRSGPANKEAASSTSSEQSKLVLTRHAAVLGLSALVVAFPYASPPPPWLPEVLATLARRAANDPGMVGQSVKTALSDFKKTRQDTWQIDMKVFMPEQLEDLEGVLWKSYFA